MHDANHIHSTFDAYHDPPYIGSGGDDPLTLLAGGHELDAREFQELLAASACYRDPICVFGHEAGGQWAEVYEREASASSPLGRFLVRLVVRDAGQYLVVLSDLPGVLAHLERLASLLADAPLSVSVPAPASASTPATITAPPATH